MRLPCIYRGLPPRTHLQHALQEKLLQLLVGRVDEQLLEGVGLEQLEAKGVEQPKAGGRCLARGREPLILHGEQPAEEPLVNHLGEPVTAEGGGGSVQRDRVK